MKRFLVTGASRGIGEAIAKQLLGEGHEIVGVSRFLTPPMEHARYFPETIDLNDLENLPEHLKQLSKKYPEIDGLILNAGRGHFGHLEQLSYAHIRSLFDLNLLSSIYFVKAFLPTLKKQQKGDIVFIGSEAALQGKKKGSIYCASKFGVRGFSQALREELAADHIRVTLINPGMVATHFFDTLAFQPGEETHEHLIAEDIAHTVSLVLNSREGTVFDEINLSPQKTRIMMKQ